MSHLRSSKFAQNDPTKEPVIIRGTYVHETEKAICVKQGSLQEWFPKSQLLREAETYQEPRDDLNKPVKTAIAITIPRWLAEAKKGFDYEEVPEIEEEDLDFDADTGEVRGFEADTVDFDDYDDIPF